MLLESKINIPEHYYGIEFKDVSIHIDDIVVDVPDWGPPISAEEYWRGFSVVKFMVNDEILGSDIVIHPSNVTLQQSKSDSYIISELEKIFNA